LFSGGQVTNPQLLEVDIRSVWNDLLLGPSRGSRLLVFCGRSRLGATSGQKRQVAGVGHNGRIRRPHGSTLASLRRDQFELLLLLPHTPPDVLATTRLVQSAPTGLGFLLPLLLARLRPLDQLCWHPVDDLVRDRSRRTGLFDEGTPVRLHHAVRWPSA
jgi:hypothetical protein